MNTVEKSMKNWAKEVIDECNSQLNEYYVAYKAKVSDWLSNFIDTYCYTKETDVTVGLKNNDKEDEKNFLNLKKSCRLFSSFWYSGF